MLRSIELGAVTAAARRLGWVGGAVYLVYSLGVFALLGGAWWAVARGEPLGRLGLFSWARLVREAVSDLLPFSQIGGMVFGARTLTAAGVPPPRVYASMAADLTTEMASQLLFTLFGVGMTASLLLGEAGAALRPALAGASLGLLAIMLVVVLGQRPLLALAGRMSRRFAGAEAAFAAVEAELAEVYRDRRRLALSFVLNLAGWTASAAGSWLLLRLIGVELPFLWAVAIEALIFTVRSVAFAVPGALGFQEAAYVMLGPVFGLPAETALVLSLAKRARDMAIGAAVLIVWHARDAREVRQVPTTS